VLIVGDTPRVIFWVGISFAQVVIQLGCVLQTHLIGGGVRARDVVIYAKNAKCKIIT
jgi:hypothetical protein